jgi:microcystin-dependent protein
MRFYKILMRQNINMDFKNSFTVVLLFSGLLLTAQTGIGTTTPNASAKLDVYSTNKGFLPPRVTLTSATDATTIASPAEGLLVYNLGSVGLQAGYYYWNGANWATIATATSAGNGVTAMDMVKLYGKGYSTAAGDIAHANGYSFTVPVSGRYVFDFSSSSYASGATATLTFKVRQGTTDLATDAQTGLNNTVHVEYNGKIEVNLQSGTTYNVYVNTTGVRDVGDYDRVYMKMVAGNLPVTGQTVEYGMARYTGADGSAIADNAIVPFDATASGNLTWSSNKFTLKANKTYELESSLAIYISNSAVAGRFQIYDYTNSVALANGLFMSQNGGGSNGQSANSPMKGIITPTSDIQVGIRLLDHYGSNGPSIIGSTSVSGITSAPNASYFMVKQIGSSAIVNPWTLSGTNTYNTTGNVGIGNNAPTTILEVTGDTKVSGVLTAGGNAFPTTTGTNGQALTTNGAGAASWNPVPPPGVITAFAGSTAPTGYLLCNGATVSRATYASLFAIIGTTYGSGDGSTTFAVPDLRSKMIVGVGQGSGLTNRTLASSGGIETKTLAISEMPSHNHSINDPGHAHSQTTVNDDFNNSGGNPPGFSADGAGSRTWTNINTSTTGITINSTGSGTAFNIMNPFLALNYIIKF